MCFLLVQISEGYHIRKNKRYLDDPSVQVPKSTKFDQKKRSTLHSNTVTSIPQSVLFTQQTELIYPESNACSNGDTLVQETEVTTCNYQGTSEMEGSSTDALSQPEMCLEEVVDSKDTGLSETLSGDLDSECDEMPSDQDSDSVTSEVFSESKESELEDEPYGDKLNDCAHDNNNTRMYSDHEKACMAVLAYVSRHCITNATAKHLIDLVKVTCPGSGTFKSLSYTQVQEVCGKCELHVYDICEVCLGLFPLDDENSFHCSTAGCVG